MAHEEIESWLHGTEGATSFPVADTEFEAFIMACAELTQKLSRPIHAPTWYQYLTFEFDVKPFYLFLSPPGSQRIMVLR
jgi:hypothetical protein